MNISLIPALLPLVLLTSAPAVPPDLCADVYLDEAGLPITDIDGRTVPRFCEPTGPEPSVWNGEVCCTFDELGATCTAPVGKRGCSIGATMWCDFAEIYGDEVVCVHPFPDTCDLGHCDEVAPPPDVTADLLCCFGTGYCHDNENG